MKIYTGSGGMELFHATFEERFKKKQIPRSQQKIKSLVPRKDNDFGVGLWEMRRKYNPVFYNKESFNLTNLKEAIENCFKLPTPEEKL